MLNGNGSGKFPGTGAASRETSGDRLHRRKVLPGKFLRSDERLMNFIHDLLINKNTAIVDDDGTDIRLAVESGADVSEERIREFTGSLSGSSELIVTEGFMHRLLKKWLPGVRIISLGMALLNKNGGRASLGPSDLYIIDARAYNSSYKDMVNEYDSIRRETGCQMNLDLHRSAIPTGSMSNGSKAVSSEEQARWIMKGRRFNRIVVESPEDIEIFKRVTDTDVIHVLELLKGDI
jgi:hypothetical protein